MLIPMIKALGDLSKRVEFRPETDEVEFVVWLPNVRRFHEALDSYEHTTWVHHPFEKRGNYHHYRIDSKIVFPEVRNA